MNSRALSSFAAILVSLGIIFMYVSPTWSGPIAKAKEAITADDKTLAAAKIFTTHEEELTAAQNAIEPSNIARLNRLLPDSINTIGTIVDLNALGAANGLSISNVSITQTPGAPIEDSGTGARRSTSAQPLDFQVNAAGSYTALKTFMAAVEKSQSLMDIQSVQVVGAAANTGVYTYLLKMRSYWLP